MTLVCSHLIMVRSLAKKTLLKAQAESVGVGRCVRLWRGADGRVSQTSWENEDKGGDSSERDRTANEGRCQQVLAKYLFGKIVFFILAS